MKKLFKPFLLLALMLVLVVPVAAQKLNISPSTVLHCMRFGRDTVKAGDSTLSFYTATRMNVVAIQAIASQCDTGSAAPALTITCKKISTTTGYGTGTTIATATIGTTGKVGAWTPSADGAVALSTTGALAAGYAYKIYLTLGAGSPVVKNLQVLVYYTQ